MSNLLMIFFQHAKDIEMKSIILRRLDALIDMVSGWLDGVGVGMA